METSHAAVRKQATGKAAWAAWAAALEMELNLLTAAWLVS